MVVWLISTFIITTIIIIAVLYFEEKFRDGHYRYIEFNLGISTIVPEDVADGLVNLQIAFCESHGLGMGGSAYSFAVEDMDRHQARWFQEVLETYLRSHNIESCIKYQMKTEEDD